MHIWLIKSVTLLLGGRISFLSLGPISSVIFFPRCLMQQWGVRWPFGWPTRPRHLQLLPLDTRVAHVPFSELPSLNANKLQPQQKNFFLANWKWGGGRQLRMASHERRESSWLFFFRKLISFCLSSLCSDRFSRLVLSPPTRLCRV